MWFDLDDLELTSFFRNSSAKRLVPRPRNSFSRKLRRRVHLPLQLRALLLKLPLKQPPPKPNLPRAPSRRARESTQTLRRV